LLLVAAGVVLATGFAQNGDSSFLSQLPAGDRWLQHLTGDLLPFWTVAAAFGNPVGAFPSVRCDDGSLLDYKKPCPPIAGNAYLLTPAQYLVSVSRQTYGYGVAYHLTGDPKYLGYMKAGIDYIRQNAVDRTGGGMFTMLDLGSNTWGPQREFRNPQELGYGLLGLAMYYYLTRDDQVLPDILAIKNYILLNYYNQVLGTMQWMLKNNGAERFDQKQLVADLDQMNTYLVLLAPILPEPQRTEWQQTLALLSRSILGTFYSPGDNLFLTLADTPQDRDVTFSGVDFGHTSKALWMMRWTGLMLGDQGMVSFAEAAGRRLFDRAYLPEDGSWAEGILAGGQTDKNKNWWISAELDQLSGTLALGDLSAGRYLPQTTDYWFKYFVDPQYGEVWNGVNYGTNTPQPTIRRPGPGKALTTRSSMPWWATSPPNTCMARLRSCITPSRRRWIKR
jgi:mannose/cellobiose epimerase-like protein (N-acyl-D-glucosamine 2-epimerase family)